MQPPVEEEDLLSAAQAARLLRVARSTIVVYEERGRLVPARVDWQGLQRRPKFRRADVEALRRPKPAG